MCLCYVAVSSELKCVHGTQEAKETYKAQKSSGSHKIHKDLSKVIKIGHNPGVRRLFCGAACNLPGSFREAAFVSYHPCWGGLVCNTAPFELALVL